MRQSAPHHPVNGGLDEPVFNVREAAKNSGRKYWEKFGSPIQAAGRDIVVNPKPQCSFEERKAPNSKAN